jgi:hypothetical protein
MTERRYAGTVRAPDFPPGMEWLNVARPLSLADLQRLVNQQGTPGAAPATWARGQAPAGPSQEGSAR